MSIQQGVIGIYLAMAIILIPTKSAQIISRINQNLILRSMPNADLGELYAGVLILDTYSA